MRLACSLVVFLLLSVPGYAQTTVLSQSFKGLSDVSGLDGWEFNEYCNPTSNYLLVGGNSGTTNKGMVVTPSLGVDGNVVLLLRTSGYEDEGARFTVTVIGQGESSNEYSVSSSSEYRPSALLIRGVAPSSRVKVESTSGRFYLRSIKIVSIDDALFYESFDYMTGRDVGEFYFQTDASKKVTASLCDNSNGTVITEVYPSTKSIYFRYKTEGKASVYVMPRISLESTGCALLTFKAGHLTQSLGNYLSVSCDGEAEMGVSSSEGISAFTNSLTIEMEKDDFCTWLDYNIVVRNMSSSTQLTFTGYGANLDEILVYPITLLDEAQNNDNIDSPQQRVQLLRTLTANIWCPLCLPFDVTQAQMEAATGTSCELRTLTSVSEGVFNFDVTTSIAAGTPFLVKTAAQVVNPLFTGVTVVSTPAATAAASTANYQFVGTYSPVTLATDGSNLFLGIYGQLYRPEAYEGHDRMNGLRAYFVVPATKSSSRVAISFGGETAGVNGSRRDKAARERLYDLQGRPVKGRMTKGLYVQEGQKVLRP